MSASVPWTPDKAKRDSIVELVRRATAHESADRGDLDRVSAVARLRELSDTTPDIGLYAMLLLRSETGASSEEADQLACSIVQSAVRRSVRDRRSVHPELVHRAKIVCIAECIGSSARRHGPRAKQALAATIALTARHFGVHGWPEVVQACRNGLRPNAPPDIRQLAARLASMLLEDACAAASGEQPQYGRAADGRKSRWGPAPGPDTVVAVEPPEISPGVDVMAGPLGSFASEGFGLGFGAKASAGTDDGSARTDARQCIRHGELSLECLVAVAIDLVRWASMGCDALRTKQASRESDRAAVSLPADVTADQAIQMLPMALEAVEKSTPALRTNSTLRDAIKHLVGRLPICLLAAASAATAGFASDGPRSQQGNQVLAAGVHATNLLADAARDHAQYMWAEIGSVWDGVYASMRQTQCASLRRAAVELWLAVWQAVRIGLHGGSEVRSNVEVVATRVAPLLVPMCVLSEEDEMGGDLPTTDVSDTAVPDELAELHPAWRHRLEAGSEEAGGGAGGIIGGGFAMSSESAHMDIDDGHSIDAAAACGASSESGGLQWTLRRSAALGLEAACFAGKKTAVAAVMPMIAAATAHADDWRQREAGVLCAGILSSSLGRYQGYSPAVEGLLKRVLHLLQNDSQPLIRRVAAWTIARVVTSTLVSAVQNARLEEGGADLEREHAAARGMVALALHVDRPPQAASPKQVRIRQAIDACFRGLLRGMSDRSKLVQRGVLAALQTCMQQASSEATEDVLVPAIIASIGQGLKSYQLRSFLAVSRLARTVCVVSSSHHAVAATGKAWAPYLLRRWAMMSKSSGASTAAVPLKSVALQGAVSRMLGAPLAPGSQASSFPLPGPKHVARYGIVSTLADVVQACKGAGAPVALQVSALACLVASDQLHAHEREMQEAKSLGAVRPPFPGEDYVRSALRLLSECSRAARSRMVPGAGSAVGSEEEGARMFATAIDQPDVFALLPRTMSHASTSIRASAFQLASGLMDACPDRTLKSARGITTALVGALQMHTSSSTIALTTSAFAAACKLLRTASRADRSLAEAAALELAPVLLASVRSGGLMGSSPLLVQVQAESIAWCCVCAPAGTAAAMRPEVLGLIALGGVGFSGLGITPSDTPVGELRELIARGCMIAMEANPKLLQPQVGPSLATLVYMCLQPVQSSVRKDERNEPDAGCARVAAAILRKLQTASGGEAGLATMLGRMPGEQREFLLQRARGL